MAYLWASPRPGAFSSVGKSHSKKTAHAAEQRRGDVNVAREDWFEGQIDLDPERLVVIDKTAVIRPAILTLSRGIGVQNLNAD